LVLQHKRVVKKIFIGKEVPGFPLIDILTSNYERFSSDANLVSKLNLESDPELADAIIIPHDLYYLRKNFKYKCYINNLAKKRPVIVFSSGDYPIFVGTKNITYLQTHFTSRIRKTNIIQIPYNAATLSNLEVAPYNSVPRSSFVGFIPRPTPRRVLYGFKSMPLDPFKSNGSFIRKSMLIKLKKVSNVIVITRDKFGRAKGYSEEILAKNRVEFIKSIKESHAVWAPRGDANQSVRFYEGLSAGRLCLIPNSNMKIPFSFCKRHKFFVAEFPWANNWGKQLTAYWNNLEKEDWENLSREIIKIYSDIFHYPRFVEVLFEDFLLSPRRVGVQNDYNCSPGEQCRALNSKLL
jgi:hypothetical protein